VTILTGKSQPSKASATELQDYFAERGIRADISTIKGRGNVAKALLARNEELGADLMIMGAYGDSHERETIFGGNTQYIVDKAKMPVVLVH
jgi:nucleotide-binding universal stress UspA family protein